MTFLSLDEAMDATRTGDIWIFRGRSAADRAIQTLTNAPVNHVGMAVVLDDLPPLMWHAELGRSLPDVWSGDHHRGVQLHDLGDAVRRWHDVYGQDAWLRQIIPEVGRPEEDAVLRTIARWDGASFPSSSRLLWRWLRGRRGGRPPVAPTQQAYCAEVVALTYEAMGLLPEGRPSSWYDPGRFWSDDDLMLTEGWALGEEIEVRVPTVS